MSEEHHKRQIEANFEGSRVIVPRKGRMVASIPKDGLISALLTLKAEGFEHLSMISCVDWIEEREMELVYHLWSYGEKIHAMVKTRIPRKEPSFLSVISLFPNAQTYERELHEMFGIHFQGHPRLIPLLLEHWGDKPPMRKDFDMRGYAKENFDVE